MRSKKARETALTGMLFALGITNLSQVRSAEWRNDLLGACEEFARVGVQTGTGGHYEGERDAGV